MCVCLCKCVFIAGCNHKSWTHCIFMEHFYQISGLLRAHAQKITADAGTTRALFYYSIAYARTRLSRELCRKWTCFFTAFALSLRARLRRL